MNIKKITTILAYLSKKIDRLTKLKALKIIYFIDKFHLMEYGRSVLTLDYKKLQYGPVPEQILNIIDNPNALKPSDHNYLEEYIEFAQDKYRTISAKKPPDLLELSKSELKIIDKVINEYGHKTPKELVDITHKELAWINAPWYSRLDIKDIVDGLNKKAKNELILNLNEDYNTQKELSSLLA